MPVRMILATVLGVVLAACSATATPSDPPTATALVAPSPSPSPSPGFVLREGTATGGCDAIGLEYQSLTWRIDPAADEAVTAVTNKGDTLVTSWAPGFTAGTADERVIRDPAGVVVVSDGDTFRVGDRLNGYFVCLGPQHLFVFTQDPQ